ncbi:MAG: diguanylate cyclase [Spirochaetia bacterium]|nr:diguanylate cyclase [Spirochaetia bacterium]
MIDSLLSDYLRETGSLYRDTLTGLYAHSIFHLVIDLHIKQAKRKSDFFSIGLIDIDLFSRYNQIQGTTAADLALKQISQCILQEIRESDLAVRLDGDTFGVLFDGSRSDASYKAADRIRRRVETEFSGELTVSIGLASFPHDAEHMSDLLRSAEESLLQAKSKGKNCIHFYDISQPLEKTNVPNVLVVDDGKTNRFILAAQLRPLGYHVILASSGEEALSIVRKTKVNLILLDVLMPGIDGYEVCRRLKKNATTRLIPIIMITALGDTESRVRGIEAGADDFLTKPPMREELIARTQSLLTVNMLNQKLTSFENVLYSIANAVEAKDHYTQGHSKRVANMAEAIGRELNLSSDTLMELRTGGLLHDVGKIGVPEKILNKPGPLTEEEMQEMKKHPMLGYTICLPLKENLGSSLEVIRHHHERLDGSGYPDGISGDELTIESRIMIVSDEYDALTTKRPYRDAFPIRIALEIMDAEVTAGKLDAEVLLALKRIVSTTTHSVSMP